MGESFRDFRQVTDDEVRDLLDRPTTGLPATPTAPGPAGLVAAAAIDAPGGMPPRDVLNDLIGDARVVMIGESSHGTHEFYAARAEITRWLIASKGFNAVAVEADWPDAYRVNRYVRGLGPWSSGDDESPEQALRGFERFPAWMWRNTVVRDFVGWLRRHNGRCATDGGRQTGFYGLDLYSLHRSMEEVVRYLATVDPQAAARARSRYACFDHCTGDDGQAYGYAAAFGAGPNCERQAVEQLIELQRDAVRLLAPDGQPVEDELFHAQQNAATVRDAEEYYRGMFASRVTSWNLRDKHMASTLRALIDHLNRHSGADAAKVVVWAHNSHVGDARATEVSADGQLTIGQLAREEYGAACRLIGFSTYRGTVTAASDWGGNAERKKVRPALAGSIEDLLHQTGRGDFYVPMHDGSPAARALEVVRLGRAIGVIYQPQTERQSHYFHVRPADQFDAMIHIDSTNALEPLDTTSVWVAGEIPETYPSGL